MKISNLLQNHKMESRPQMNPMFQEKLRCRSKAKYQTLEAEMVGDSRETGNVVMSQMTTSFGSNVMTKEATDEAYLEKYRTLKMEPPVRKLHVPQMKINYL